MQAQGRIRTSTPIVKYNHLFFESQAQTIQTHHSNSIFEQGILNLKVTSDGSVISESHIAHVTADGKCALSKLPNTETRCALLANLFYAEGKPGKVIRVHCKHRIGADNFVSSCRNIVAKHYADKVVGRSII